MLPLYLQDGLTVWRSRVTEGVNVGAAAGQTVFYLHVHVIPRYNGDVPDPRGGIRKIKESIVPYAGEGEG